MLAQCGAFPFDAKRRVVQYTPLAEADSDLRGGTDDDLIYINFNWLLDGERNSASDRIRRHRDRVPPLFEVGLDLWTGHTVREVRPRHSG